MLNEVSVRDVPAHRGTDGANASVVPMCCAVLPEARLRGAAALLDYAVLPDDAVVATAVPPGDVMPPRFCVSAVRRGSVSALHRYVLSSCEMRFLRLLKKQSEFVINN